MEEENVKEDDKDDVYSEEGREDLVDGDEISPAEEGFMEGAHDGGQGAEKTSAHTEPQPRRPPRPLRVLGYASSPRG